MVVNTGPQHGGNPASCQPGKAKEVNQALRQATALAMNDHLTELSNKPRLVIPGIVTTVEVFEDATEVPIQFDTVVGFRYQLRSSLDLITWTVLPAIYHGTGFPMTIFVPIDAGRKSFDLIQLIPEGSEMALSAVVAWDGSRVELVFKPVGPGAFLHVIKDGNLRATVPSHSLGYTDGSVAAGKHVYSLQVFK